MAHILYLCNPIKCHCSSLNYNSTLNWIKGKYLNKLAFVGHLLSANHNPFVMSFFSVFVHDQILKWSCDLIKQEEKEAIPAFHSTEFLRLSQKHDKFTLKPLVNLQYNNICLSLVGPRGMFKMHFPYCVYSLPNLLLHLIASRIETTYWLIWEKIFTISCQ